MYEIYEKKGNTFQKRFTYKKINREQLIVNAVKRLQAIQGEGGDREDWHVKADDILVDLLSKTGFREVVEEWLKIPKWYS